MPSSITDSHKIFLVSNTKLNKGFSETVRCNFLIRHNFFGYLFNIESKVGKVSFSSFTIKQLEKDVDSLIENKNKVIWVFTKSPTTNKIGFDPRLLEYKNELLDYLILPRDSIEFIESSINKSDLIN
jgi:hypothetical protein